MEEKYRTGEKPLDEIEKKALNSMKQYLSEKPKKVYVIELKDAILVADILEWIGSQTDKVLQEEVDRNSFRVLVVLANNKLVSILFFATQRKIHAMLGAFDKKTFAELLYNVKDLAEEDTGEKEIYKRMIS